MRNRNAGPFRKVMALISLLSNFMLQRALSAGIDVGKIQQSKEHYDMKDINHSGILSSFF